MGDRGVCFEAASELPKVSRADRDAGFIGDRRRGRGVGKRWSAGLAHQLEELVQASCQPAVIRAFGPDAIDFQCTLISCERQFCVPMLQAHSRPRPRVATLSFLRGTTVTSVSVPSEALLRSYPQGRSFGFTFSSTYG